MVNEITMVKSDTESCSLLVGWYLFPRILKFPCSNTGYADEVDMLTDRTC